MKTLLKISVIGLFTLFASLGYAQQANTQYKEGVHYFKVQQPLKVTTGNKIEVRELFWYGCPHCYQLEPYIIKWLENKPDNIEFIATPAVFSKRWIFHAKAYYAIQSLGLEEKAHPLIFETIHGKRKPVSTVKQLSTLLKENFGIEEEKVNNAMRSFSVDSNVRAANSISVKSGADGVPTIIIDGKYRTSSHAAGGANRVFDLVNYLVKKSQSER